MAEVLDESQSLESTTVGVYRTAATVKGGRRFSFSSLVVVGDKNGRVGIGYGKANQVPPAIEKAQKEAKRKMKPFPMTGRTIPHEVTGRFGSCRVRLIPASPGTGIIAGSAVRAPLEMMGLQDCLTKSFGSNNGKNLVKAVMNGLEQLRSKEMVSTLRGVELGETAVEEAIERGRAFLKTDAKPAEPTEIKPEDVAADKSSKDEPKAGKDRPKPAEREAKAGASSAGKAPETESPAPAEAAAEEPTPDSESNQESPAKE